MPNTFVVEKSVDVGGSESKLKIYLSAVLSIEGYVSILSDGDDLGCYLWGLVSGVWGGIGRLVLESDYI